MARPERNTVDYFPHIIGDGKKIFYIESKYKNDGYATWFKILEQLALTEYHYLDLNNEETVMYLAARCFIDENRLFDIINDLTRLGVFDKFLWQNKYIWCPYFITNIADAYSTRKNECITYAGLLETLNGLGVTLVGLPPTIDPLKPHTILYNTIEDNTIVKNTKGWREDFEVFKFNCFEAFKNLLLDSDFLAQQKKFNPGVDIQLTLEKAVTTFWATEAGWKNKKKSRTKEIDWKATLTNAISAPMNKVYLGQLTKRNTDYNSQKEVKA